MSCYNKTAAFKETHQLWIYTHEWHHSDYGKKWSHDEGNTSHHCIESIWNSEFNNHMGPLHASTLESIHGIRGPEGQETHTANTCIFIGFILFKGSRFISWMPNVCALSSVGVSQMFPSIGPCSMQPVFPLTSMKNALRRAIETGISPDKSQIRRSNLCTCLSPWNKGNAVLFVEKGEVI